jgi:protocatechuate 3,4-dioxygenase beta subunit
MAVLATAGAGLAVSLLFLRKFEPANAPEATARTVAPVAARPATDAVLTHATSRAPDLAAARRSEPAAHVEAQEPESARLGRDPGAADETTRIRVVDSRQRPVAGAAVEIWLERPGAAPSASGDTLTAWTDERGLLEIQEAWSQLRAVAWSEHATSAATQLSAVVEEVKLVLIDSRGVGGRVRDASTGRPIAGARISAWTHASSDVVESDAGGAFHHPRLPASGSRQQVRVTAPGYAPSIALVEFDEHKGTRSWAGPRAEARVHGPGSDAWLEFELSPAARIRGHVRDPGGAPIAHARLRAEGYALLWSGAASPDTADALSDENGAYELAGLRPGVAHAVSVEAAAYATQVVELGCGAELTHDFRLEPEATVEGLLLDPAGIPAEGLQIELRRTDAPAALECGADSVGVRRLGRRARTSTDAAGAFMFEGLGPHRYQLRATRGPRELLRHDFAAAPAENISLPPLTLEPSALTMQGLVEAPASDTRESEFAGWRIETWRDRLLGSVNVGGDGSFRIAGLDAEAPYELRLYSEGASGRLLVSKQAWAYEPARLVAPARD